MLVTTDSPPSMGYAYYVCSSIKSENNVCILAVLWFRRICRSFSVLQLKGGTDESVLS